MAIKTQTTQQPQQDLSHLSRVVCVFPDIGAFPRGKLMHAAALAQGQALNMAKAILLQAVCGGYGSDEVVGETDADMRLLPAWQTLRTLPWARDYGWLVHDCTDIDGKLIEYAPRSVLHAVLARYAAHGWTPVVAPEIEFYLFARDGKAEQGFNLPQLAGGIQESSLAAYSAESLHAMPAFWDELFSTLESLQLPYDTWLHEMGPSQYELNLLHGDALKAADQVLLFKTALRQVASHHQLSAVFMAKPLAGKPGSSMHLHQSVVDKKGSNIFSDKQGGPSTHFLNYLGGLQQYLPELLPIFAPYINSWRRYTVSASAPLSLDWGEDNRTVALRSPSANAKNRRIENRLAGADANPYLAIAASLACGLVGMEQNLQPRQPNNDCHGYHGPAEITGGLEAAVLRMRHSKTAQQLLGKSFIEGYCSVKDVEIEHFMNEVSAWDRRFLGAQV